MQNAELIKELNRESKEAAKVFDDEVIQKMANNENLDVFYGASTLVIVSGMDKAMMPQVDCAAATQNMLLAAESLNVGSCWNGFISFLFFGPKKEEYMKKLNIPEGFTPYYAVALGYKDTKAINAPARREGTVQYIR